MKVLIISDDEELVQKTDSFFKSYGFDTIKYKWLLKALDNIEEIEPNLIVLSSSEYPRHWKTLVQFAKSGIGGDKVDVFLYEATPLAEDEVAKAKALGISGYFTELENIVLKDVFKEYIKTDVKPAETPEIEEDELPTVDAIVTQTVKLGHLLVTNPVHNNLVCGKVLSKNNNRIEAQLDFALTDVQNNDLVKNVTYFDEAECYSFSAEIFILNEENNTVILSMQERYEEI